MLFTFDHRMHGHTKTQTKLTSKYYLKTLWSLGVFYFQLEAIWPYFNLSLIYSELLLDYLKFNLSLSEKLDFQVTFEQKSISYTILCT